MDTSTSPARRVVYVGDWFETHLPDDSPIRHAGCLLLDFKELQCMSTPKLKGKRGGSADKHFCDWRLRLPAYVHRTLWIPCMFCCFLLGHRDCNAYMHFFTHRLSCTSGTLTSTTAGHSALFGAPWANDPPSVPMLRGDATQLAASTGQFVVASNRRARGFCGDPGTILKSLQLPHLDTVGHLSETKVTM
jgi:hypothetical protein